MSAGPPGDDLGENRQHLAAVVARCGDHAVLVELGVDHGGATRVLLAGAEDRRNVVHGVDIRFPHLPYALMTHPCHRRVRADSVTAGWRWAAGPIDLLFVDTLHVAPQVLCELHAWTPHLRPGGFVVVHDTAWPDGRHDLTWLTGGGVDDVRWPTPDHALAAFFGIEDAFAAGKHTGFGHDDAHVSVVHHPGSWGMTVVQIHDPGALAASRRLDWTAIFGERERLLRLVLGDAAIGSLRIALAPPDPVGAG